MVIRKIHELRRGRPFGSPVRVNERIAAALVAQGTHGYADDFDVPPPEASPPPPVIEPVRPTRTKRQYRRRDMRAEGE